MVETIYLDNAATTFPKPREVGAAIQACLEGYCVNSGRGVYPLAQQAERIIANTRMQVQRLLGVAGQGEIVYSSSITVALNQILFGSPWKRGDAVYVTPYEHNSVFRPLAKLRSAQGIQINELTEAVSRDRLEWDLDKVKEAFFQCPPKAVVLSHVGNVCGNLTPIEGIARLAKEYGAVVIVDGAQGGGLFPINNTSLIDFYAFSGHKTFYGPFGIAGFWKKKECILEPILFGGTGTESEREDMPDEGPARYEVGSPNILAIAGLSGACDWLEQIGSQSILQHEQELLKELISGMENIEGVTVYGSKAALQSGFVSINVAGYTAQTVAMILSQEYGIAVRAGLHCAPRAHTFLGTIEDGGTVRIGLGYFNTRKEILVLLSALNEMIEIA